MAFKRLFRADILLFKWPDLPSAKIPLFLGWVFSWVFKKRQKKCVKMGDKSINVYINVRKMRLYMGDLPPKYICLHIYNILNRSHLREWTAV